MRWIVASLVIIFVSIGGLIKVGLRFNTSASVPVGFYWLKKTSPRKGDLVLFCPLKSEVFKEAQARGYLGIGHCPNNTGYLIKKVMAAQGDSVSINDDGVTINEIFIVNSKPLSVDRQERPLSHYTLDNYRLKDDEVLLLSDYSAYSFDGRYFGLLSNKNICGVLKSLWAW